MKFRNSSYLPEECQCMRNASVGHKSMRLCRNVWDSPSMRETWELWYYNLIEWFLIYFHSSWTISIYFLLHGYVFFNPTSFVLHTWNHHYIEKKFVGCIPQLGNLPLTTVWRIHPHISTCTYVQVGVFYTITRLPPIYLWGFQKESGFGKALGLVVV